MGEENIKISKNKNIPWNKRIRQWRNRVKRLNNLSKSTIEFKIFALVISKSFSLRPNYDFNIMISEHINYRLDLMPYN